MVLVPPPRGARPIRTAESTDRAAALPWVAAAATASSWTRRASSASLSAASSSAAGSSGGAPWKVKGLAAAGAHVDVYAPEPSEELRAVPGEIVDGQVAHVTCFFDLDLFERFGLPATYPG